MSGPTFRLKAKVWLYAGKSAWHFATLPKRVTNQIKSLFGGLERGWGSFPVSVTIGKTTWQTSIFPDSKTATFLLPLKAEVRKKESLVEGKTITIKIELLV